MLQKDTQVIRELATRYNEYCQCDRNKNLRKLWIKHNDKERTEPLILVGFSMYNIMYTLGDDDLVINDITDEKLVCEDPVARSVEKALRWKLYHISVQDDTIFEPYILFKSVRTPTDEQRWGGVSCGLGEKVSASGAAGFSASIHDEKDIDKIFTAPHKVDREATAKIGERYQELLGDSLTAYPDTRPALFRWTGDVSTDFAKLIGLEQMYYDFYERPEMLHKLLAIMRDAVLRNNEEWEAAGDCRTSAGFNQCMPYSGGIKLPEKDESCNRSDIWVHFAAQEFTSTSAAFFEEFCLNYQLPIMEKFGLVAYGCCEDLTNKIHSLRRIKNLRRISISPFAKAESCVEQIGKDFVISYRPNPSTMVAFNVDENVIRNELSVPLAAMKKNESYFDIDLKDVHTVSGSKTALIEWVKVVRKIVSEQF